ncbi:hypothetical protein AMATHDRAFT_47883 [Amanita thiersii Skay4041]|uniref:Uncharacterized protein n=1 Tax=Amanita thiersii Skay4041 TaxID=703135 RepID=A0A2A9NHK5_9AGAR|nr:hypothetical protein AMATHDRAFT_47883 [Amanita thiersii Skay4041]
MPNHARLVSVYPSLTPETIDHLKVLFQRGIDPNPDVVNTLVQLLKATHEDIVAWIQDNTLYTSPSPEVVRQMPTPGPTTSPEPVRLKSEPAHSPLLLHTSLKSKASESSQIQEIQDPVPPRHVILTIPSKIVVDDHPGVLPRSASDFINLFTPYQDKMEQVLEAIT